MTYQDLSNGDRSCPTDPTHEAAGVSNAGTPECAMPTTPKPDGLETPTVSDRKTYAQIVAQRQKEAHEREQQAKAWSAEVTEKLMNERSKFILEFTTDEKRIFGVLE